MKKIVSFLLLLVILQDAFSQKGLLPDVSKKVEFAGITVKLDVDAQKMVQKEVNALLTPENKYLLDKLERIQQYFPIIETILEQEDVPEDFKYLAVVESSLLPDAISSSNAVGYWQMKPATAQEIGLRVDKDIDERKNIYSSTKAAAIYLKRNNLIYKNWISTLYSYTLGASGVSKLIPSEWAYATEVNFNAQTDRYLIKTIAHRIAFEYRINRLKESPFGIVEYKKTKGKTLDEIASMADVDANQLKKYNSWLITNNVPSDKEYSVAILVPADRIEDVQSKLGGQNEFATNNAAFPILKRVTAVNVSDEEPIFYEINGKKGILARPGDDIAALARFGKLQIKDFLRYNDLTNKDMVEEGKVYYLKSKNRKGSVPLHVVLIGQTMWQISQMYGIRMQNLLRLNRMNTVERIQKGRVVYLQKKRPKNQPIESLNEKNSEDLEKAPMNEQYNGLEEKVLVKDARKPEVIEEKSSKNTKSNIPENTTIEENSKSSSRSEKDEDDIIVISDTDVVPATKQPSQNTDIVVTPTPPASIKTTPVKSSPTTTNPPSVSSTSTHTVDIGQTLYSVARQYKVSVKELAAWNNFGTDERVKVGQVIIIKAPSKSYSPTANETKPSSTSSVISSSSSTHEVQKTETLYSISKRYGVSTKQIQDWNGMTDNNVKIGQKLIIRK